MASNETSYMGMNSITSGTASQQQQQLQENFMLIDKELQTRGFNIIQAGADSTGATDSTAAISKALNNSSEALVPSGTYLTNGKISIPANKSLTGIGGTIKNEATTGTAIELNGSSSNVFNLSVDSQADITVNVTSNVKKTRLSRMILSSRKQTVNIDSPNIEDVTITDSTLDSTRYGVLLNQNAKTGRILRILNNNISSKLTDAIELNNPTVNNGENYDGFSDVFIIGNSLAANNGENVDSNSGFAIGIANTHNVVSVANITTRSRLEAVHIEDNQENIIISSNVFSGCMRDGARILSNTLGRPPIVTNNHFVKQDLSKTDIGIYRVWDAKGQLESILTNNYVRGFDAGYFIDGNAPAQLGGCIAEDCNVAVRAGNGAVVMGEILSKNCPVLAEGNENSIIDRIVSSTPITKVLNYKGTTANGNYRYVGTTLKSFAAPTTVLDMLSSTTGNYDLFDLPTMIQGKLQVRGRSVNAGYSMLMATCDIFWNGTTLNVTNLWSSSAYLFGKTVTFTANNGKLALNVYTPATRFKAVFNFDFTGVYYVEGA